MSRRQFEEMTKPQMVICNKAKECEDGQICNGGHDRPHKLKMTCYDNCDDSKCIPVKPIKPKKKVAVCKWETTYEEKASVSFLTGCKYGLILFLKFAKDLDYKICPYCGKKIALLKKGEK